MSNKLFTVIVFVLLTALAGSASAMDLFWLNTSGDGLWKTPANWTSGILPTIVDKTKINQLPGPLIDASTAAVANWVVVGNGGTGAFRMTGGTLTVGTAPGDTWIIVAYDAADNGTITMDGGTITTADRVFVGFQGTGTLNMNGGTINIGGKFGIGNNDAGGLAGKGYVNLDGGTINVAGAFDMSTPTGCVGKLDINSPGTLVLSGDKRTTVQSYIDNGYIVAYGGMGIVNVSYDGVKTIVTGAVDTTKAKVPYPANNATDAPPYAVLTWVQGDGAVWHDVYFGTDANSILDANTSTPGIYKGRQSRDANSFEPTGLGLGQKYYWRIDEVNEPNIYKGALWQFTVADNALVDDFESYTDTNAMLTSWSKAGTGATLSLATTGGHDKAKTMKFDYNNSGAPYYSEAQDAAVDFNWTIDGVLAIDIWFKGNAGNAAVPMYAALEDSNGHPVAVITNSDPNIVKAADWQAWRIKLSDFTGVNLSNVKKFYIGFGSRSNPQVGGSGTVYFDDIRLYPSRCLDKPLVDLNDDCVVDFKDFAIMAGNWMSSS
ncbi:MAG: hypothetical protein ABSE89_11655 [Sedimentisphaerales bacterium]